MTNSGDDGWRIKALDAIKAESPERVKKVVEQLPQRTRRVITLAKVYDCTIPEIARRLNITESEVETELGNAVRAMADELDDTDTH